MRPVQKYLTYKSTQESLICFDIDKYNKILIKNNIVNHPKSLIQFYYF